MEKEYGNTVKKLKVGSRKRSQVSKSRELMKKLRLSSHELGPDCKCTRYGCFEKVTVLERQRIIKQFNVMQTRDDQNLYLASLITVSQIKKYRPRRNKEKVNFHESAYKYQVRIGHNNNFIDLPICQKAFLSLHGITGRRLQTIQESLKKSGIAPKDMRGKYVRNRNIKPSEILEVVKNHIESFIASNYSDKEDVDIVYLPEALSVQKMYFMYNNLKLPEVSYEYYQKVFSNDFNILFTTEKASLEDKVEETAFTEYKLEIKQET